MEDFIIINFPIIFDKCIYINSMRRKIVIFVNYFLSDNVYKEFNIEETWERVSEYNFTSNF